MSVPAPSSVGMTPETYATVEEYRAIIAKSDDGSDLEIELALRGISRYLDRKLGRIFGRDDEPHRRHYRGGWSCWVVTDDMSEPPATVAIGVQPGQSLEEVPPAAPSDFELYPANALLSPEPRPFEGLHLFQPLGPASFGVDIVARWGWPAVPPAVTLATIEVTGIWRLETPRATARVNELDQVIGTSEMANRIVKDLMLAYARRPWVVA